MDITDLFKKNIQRWATFDGAKAALLTRLDCVATSFVPSASGAPNLQIKALDKLLYLHSESDPVKEAQEWFSNLSLKDVDVLFVYGVGLGYAYDALKGWLHDQEGRYLVFLEPSLEILKRLFETERGTEILHDKKVWLLHLDPEGNTLKHLAANFILKSRAHASLPFYKQLTPLEADRIKVQLDYLMNNRWGMVSEYSDHGRVFHGNYFPNLLLLPEARFGNQLFGQFKGVPAIVCGAGPSLAKNIEVLKTLKDKALIFAGATAMNALNGLGVIPHFGVGIDPNRAQFTRLIMNDAFEVPYFYRQRFLNQALKTVHGDHLFLTGTIGYDIGKWMEERLQITAREIPEGYNVVNMSTAIAEAMGCSPIIFVGLDLAYTDMRSYAPGVVNHPLHNLRDSFRTKSHSEEIVQHKDIYGESTLTLWKWLSESAWYTQFSATHPQVMFVNSTEGGIGFEGIPNIPLDQVAEGLLTKNYDLEGWVAQAIEPAQLPASVTEEEILKQIRILYESLQTCIHLCTTMYDDLEKALTDLNAGNEISPMLFSEEGVQALMRFEGEEAYKGLLKVFNDTYRLVFTRDFTQLDYDYDLVSEKEILSRKIILARARYKYLRVTAKSVIGFIDELQDASARKKRRHLAPKESKKVRPEYLEDIYSFKNGLLHIKDDELGLSIEESFKPDPNSEVEREFYPSGVLRAERFFLKGLLHGPAYFYSPEGRLLSQRWFYQGLQEGKGWTYYNSGAVKRVQRLKQGKWQGFQQSYYPDGTLKSILPYDLGRLDGEVLLYYPDGTLSRQLFYKQGKRHGKERIWNEEGLLLIEAEFNMNHPTGIARRWYENGNMAEEVIYKENAPTPQYREWEESGTPKARSTYYKYDYFDKVSIETGKLTDALEGVLANVAHVAPLIASQTEATEGSKFQESMRRELVELEAEIKVLRGINKELLFETGLDPSNPEEAIWKSPETRKEVEKQIDDLTLMMCKELNHIQGALIKTVGLLSQKLAQPIPPPETPEPSEDKTDAK